MEARKYFENINWDMFMNDCEDPIGELAKRAEIYAKQKMIEENESMLALSILHGTERVSFSIEQRINSLKKR